METDVFISYSHKDRRWLTDLQTHLSPLKNITTWDDTKIAPGMNWKDEIEHFLESAKVAVLLVSKDSLASDFIQNVELPIMLDAAQARGTKIIWIALTPSVYKSTPIAKYQAANEPGRPLSSLRGDQRDSALVRVCEAIIAATKDKKQKQTKDILEDHTSEPRPFIDNHELNAEPSPSQVPNDTYVAHERAVYLEQLAIFDRHANKLGRQRPPTILMCGARGVGKTTTINTLFGVKIGEVGHDGPETKIDHLYEWAGGTSTINIVDLPGLGENPRADRKYEAMYRRRVKEADAVIVVVEAGRGALTPTIRTVEILLLSGLKPSLINFGFNKLSYLRYSGQDGAIRQVNCDPVRGVWDIEAKRAVQKSKERFLADLKNSLRRDLKGMPTVRFSIDQVIEYDSDSGWNMEGILKRIGSKLPVETLWNFQKSLDEPERRRHRKIKEITGADPDEPALESVRKNVLERVWDGISGGVRKIFNL